MKHLRQIAICAGLIALVTAGCNDALGPSTALYRIAFAGCLEGRCWFVSYREDGTEAELLFESSNYIFCPSVSPDGHRVVFEDYPTGRIVEVNLQTHSKTQLVSDSRPTHCPSLSRDGARIAYYAGTIGDLWLMVANADGSNPRQLWDGVGHLHAPAWSADGRSLAVPDAAGRIVEVDVETGSEVRVVSASGFQAAWRPDGSAIVVTRQLTNATVLVWVNADGSGERLLSPLIDRNDHSQHAFPSWAPDGQRLAFRRFVDPGPSMARTAGVMTASGQIINWPNNATFMAEAIMWLPR